MPSSNRPPALTSAVRWALLGIATFYLSLIGLCMGQVVCLRALVYPGLVTHECPSGSVLPTPTLRMGGLQRGGEGTVIVGLLGSYSTGAADWADRAELLWGRAALTLVHPDGTETALEPVKRWSWSPGARTARVVLPQVPDGDYTLRARVRTWAGEATKEVPLPLYAPALGHVLTDRPLYEAGQTVQVRALLVRAADQTPLAQRAGRFVLTDPSGQVLFEERMTTDAWGVAATTIPLDPGAESGDWTVSLVSGDDSATASVAVRPFTLPRMTVEGAGDAPWYRAGDAPVIRGTVAFSSGAPVAGAQLQVDWDLRGDWPLPVSWRGDALPPRATADANGAFVLTVPPIPDDLFGTTTLSARVTATAPSGEQATGLASVLLSEDAILADVVTELEGGLVEGFNNRVFLRLTTPDGQPLRNTDLTVRRAWDPRDPGEDARTDADGVARLQLDPGPAVNVVVPQPPERPPELPAPLQRQSARDLVTESTPTLGDLLALDRGLSLLSGCAQFTRDPVTVELGVAVSARGTVTEVASDDGLLARCLADGHRAVAFGPGAERRLALRYQVRPADRPDLRVSLSGATTVPSGLRALVEERALAARTCLPDTTRSGELGDQLTWSLRAGSRAVAVGWLPKGDGGVLSAAHRACVRGRFAGLQLSSPASTDALGVARLRTQAAPSRAVPPRRTNTMLGYELAVTATADEETLGEAVVRLRPGAVPDLRLRMDPVLPEPGDTVTVEMLRGPSFSGELPKEVYLRAPNGALLKSAVEKNTRTASFVLPDDAAGWYTMTLFGAVGRVFVAPATTLDVAVSADAATYAPGATAALTVTTTRDGQPVAAGVGLVGVDATLGQLVPLPTPGDLDELRPTATTTQPAFGVLDGAALTMGRIQGENARLAAVLRVTTVPEPAALERPVSRWDDDVDFDPVLPLTDAFYAVLAELHAAVRAWEAAAPEGERMTPERMARFWREARRAAESKGEPATDAFGRPLRLSRLPSDLLALTDPRQVVVDGTRLPEDVERWDLYVAEEDPR